MPGDFEHLHFQAEEISRRCFFDQKVGVDGLEFELKSEAAKKLRVGNHWCRRGMASNWAVEPAFGFRDIWDVIEVSMREEEKFYIDLASLEPLARSIGCIKENPSLRCLNQIAVGFKNAAAESLVNHAGGSDFASKLTRES
jgi:hypothetical protein